MLLLVQIRNRRVSVVPQPHQVYPRLVSVHRVQYNLRKQKQHHLRLKKKKKKMRESEIGGNSEKTTTVQLVTPYLVLSRVYRLTRFSLRRLPDKRRQRRVSFFLFLSLSCAYPFFCKAAADRKSRKHSITYMHARAELIEKYKFIFFSLERLLNEGKSKNKKRVQRGKRARERVKRVI